MTTGTSRRCTVGGFVSSTIATPGSSQLLLGGAGHLFQHLAARRRGAAADLADLHEDIGLLRARAAVPPDSASTELLIASDGRRQSLS
jgi:hypothetical protein